MLGGGLGGSLVSGRGFGSLMFESAGRAETQQLGSSVALRRKADVSS